MAQVLGWESRLPAVAGCDRKKVMGLWSHYCRGIVPQEYTLDFAKVRSLGPQQFVEKLAKELDVKGVVAAKEDPLVGHRLLRILLDQRRRDVGQSLLLMTFMVLFKKLMKLKRTMRRVMRWISS